MQVGKKAETKQYELYSTIFVFGKAHVTLLVFGQRTLFEAPIAVLTQSAHIELGFEGKPEVQSGKVAKKAEVLSKLPCGSVLQDIEHNKAFEL